MVVRVNGDVALATEKAVASYMVFLAWRSLFAERGAGWTGGNLRARAAFGNGRKTHGP
jgi:hypothetical protein